MFHALPRPARLARLIGLAVAVVLLLASQASAALGYVAIESSGRIGAWSVADSSSDVSVGCVYKGQDLSQITVSPPTVFGQAVHRRKVSWQFDVLRLQWWREYPGNYEVAYSSPVFKARVTRTTSAPFTAAQWLVPNELRTAYDACKVRIRMTWYAGDGTTQAGHVTIELEYHQVSDADSVQPATIEAGNCHGSFTAPVAPPAEPRAPVPAGFERMSHWQPYWAKFSETKVAAAIADLQRMHQTGVLLSGMDSGHQYSLPANVSHYLTMFRDAGIKPYLALWVTGFSDADLTVSKRAWNAGDGQWAGIVLDVERGLELAVEANRAATITRMDAFMAEFRPKTSFLAYSSFAYPADHPDMLYSELNAVCDVYMPQLYLNANHPTALGAFDALQEQLDLATPSWADPPKPIVPVVNDWGANANVARLQQYIDIAFARYGAVSGWRLHPDMSEATKDLWASITP